jgi:hypothetical protein
MHFFLMRDNNHLSSSFSKCNLGNILHKNPGVYFRGISCTRIFSLRMIT